MPAAPSTGMESLPQSRLAPTPLNKNVAAPAVNPAVRNPAGVRTWRLFPPAGIPGVGIAIPAMVPANPHIARTGCRSPRFDYSYGWPYLNHNFGGRGAKGQRSRKNQSDQTLINHTLSLSQCRKLSGGTCTTQLLYPRCRCAP